MSSRASRPGHAPRPGSGPAPAFRARRLSLPNGELLVLGPDGTIEHRDAVGAAVRTWATDDPGWPDQAIRFGIHPSATTVVPRGRDIPGSKPPA